VRPDRFEDRLGAEQNPLGLLRNHLVEDGVRPDETECCQKCIQDMTETSHERFNIWIFDFINLKNWKIKNSVGLRTIAGERLEEESEPSWCNETEENKF
jgi:hypothetical protein